MGFVLFSNLDDFNVDANLYPVADFFLKDISKKTIDKKIVKVDSTKAILKNPFAYEKFVGSYTDEQGIKFSFTINNNKIYWHSYGRTRLMRANKDTIFKLEDPTVKFAFKVNNVTDTILTQSWPNNQRVLHKYLDIKFSDEQLQNYVGTYYSPELDSRYSIVLRNHELFLTNDKYSDSKIKLEGGDHIFNDNWWMDHLKVIRNSKNQIDGFEVNSDRVQHLPFNKIE